jgi:hypothetical protein
MHYSYKTKNLLESLGIKPMKMEKETLEPQIIFVNNQGAIKLSKNSQHHNWTKHINVKYHFICKSNQSGLI